MHVRTSSSITISSRVEWPKITHQQGWGSKWVNPSSPTPPCWVNIRLDHILWWAKQYDLFGEYVPCWIHVQAHRNRQTFNLSRGRWHQMVMSILTNATWHDTYEFGLIYYGTCESLAAPPPPKNIKINGTSDLQPGHQDLCPINTQTTRIWDRLCTADTWLIWTAAYKLE